MISTRTCTRFYSLFLVAVTLVEISRTSKIKFKDFQGPDLISITFQAWKIKEENVRAIKGLHVPCLQKMY